jgi:6,7-dimethyl-8-ribityllumazine synthase
VTEGGEIRVRRADEPRLAGDAPPDELLGTDPTAADGGAAEPVVEADEAPERPPAATEHVPGGLRIPEGVGVYVGSPNGTRRWVGIVVARFNGEITTRLLDGALGALEDAGVERARIDVMQVPGAFELPLAAMAMAKTRRYACVLALGCVVRGDTPHFDYVASEAASGIQLAGLETGIPVSFGVLTCDDRAQAEARAGGDHGNKGAEAAESALEMADVFARLRSDTAAADRP